MATMAAFSIATALATKDINGFAAVINGLNLPVLLLGGVLLPISLGPAWMRVLAHLNPLYYAVAAARVLAAGTLAQPGGVAGVRGAGAAVRGRAGLGHGRGPHGPWPDAAIRRPRCPDAAPGPATLPGEDPARRRRMTAPAIPLAPSRSPRISAARTVPVSGSSRDSSAAVPAGAVRRPRKYSV